VSWTEEERMLEDCESFIILVMAQARRIVPTVLRDQWRHSGRYQTMQRHLLFWEFVSRLPPLPPMPPDVGIIAYHGTITVPEGQGYRQAQGRRGHPSIPDSQAMVRG
jgi:hypothetical protein